MPEDADVVQKYVNIFCNKNRFSSLKFCDTHTKPHGVRVLIKHCHMLFYKILVHDICAIHQIPCVYVECNKCATNLYHSAHNGKC